MSTCRSLYSRSVIRPASGQTRPSGRSIPCLANMREAQRAGAEVLYANQKLRQRTLQRQAWMEVSWWSSSFSVVVRSAARARSRIVATCPG
eukprot:CAMPEP_0206555134 /NCGR_PEP_ID=MMETSP0325_2-20121206/17602_1 /ASSEMBLY_ACC=CAM_ASM_000347 /TAXON_ID=2866 /ORGANISM="Crypthecodinium cohnii, Strain Seligo" /LENGTH=90 /DNA_ID=CAMNT_0054055355 /DNA_START=232 /DNA_END=501 /DNA_ORIENTATION=-